MARRIILVRQPGQQAIRPSINHRPIIVIAENELLEAAEHNPGVVVADSRSLI